MSEKMNSNRVVLKGIANWPNLAQPKGINGSPAKALAARNRDAKSIINFFISMMFLNDRTQIYEKTTDAFIIFVSLIKHLRAMKKSLLLCCIMAAFVFAGCAKAPASISVSPSSKELTEGETADFTATVLPENAKYSAITWTSSDKAVAMVEGGHVMAVGAGKATITASTEGVSGTAQVTVKAKLIPVGGITLDKTNLELTEEDEATLVATVTPDNATDKNVTWSSSDQTVASVDQTGKVKALKPGTATVSAKAGDAEAKCQVTVKQKIIPVTSISIHMPSMSVV